MALPDLTGMQSSFRHPPFLSTTNEIEDLKTFLHWQQTSELHTRPQVQQFGSIPHLLQLTASVDLLEISKGMKEHSAKLRSEAASFWHSMLQRFEASEDVPESRSLPALTPIDINADEQQGDLRAVLDCSSEQHDAWSRFRRAFQSHAAAGFAWDEKLQVMAQSLWSDIQRVPESFATASALFHQVIIGEAPVALLMDSGHCHYGVVAALFVLARHDLQGNGGYYCTLALQMLGGYSALDFLEDSAWPLSARDLASLMIQLQSASAVQKVKMFISQVAVPGRVRFILEASVPWTFTHGFNAFTGELPNRKWKVAIVGVHPSLSADVAFAVNAALQSRMEHRYFGLSCPAHHSAVHHCSFRCEVLGQCSNDAIFDVILGQMLNFAEFTAKTFDQKVLMNDLRQIVSSDTFLKGAEFQICTGPYFLCHMLQLILDVPLLVYMGLTLTYMAPGDAVEEILKSAHSIAADFTWGTSPGNFGTRRTAIVATDLIRTAQFHHATGRWIAALPPLSLYQPGLASKTTRNLEAIALRPELWRRAAFGAGLRGLIRHFTDSTPMIAFQTHFLPMRTILSYSAAILIPWDNDVMSFYELYHSALPLLMPDEQLMTKWLPAVRWGSLEYDQQGEAFSPCAKRLDAAAPGLHPWMNQSNLQGVLEAQGSSWIAASDYYRFPHLQHFHSVANLLQSLRNLPLKAVSSGMRSASRRIRSGTLAAYGRVLQHLLGDQRSTSSREPSGLTSADRWNQMQQGGTCKNGFITQADFVQDPKGSPQVGLQRCLRFCDETAGCAVAVFNGLTCMIYDHSCDTTDLRREGDRGGYVAWKRA